MKFGNVEELPYDTFRKFVATADKSRRGAIISGGGDEMATYGYATLPSKHLINLLDFGVSGLQHDRVNEDEILLMVGAGGYCRGPLESGHFDGLFGNVLGEYHSVHAFHGCSDLEQKNSVSLAGPVGNKNLKMIGGAGTSPEASPEPLRSLGKSQSSKGVNRTLCRYAANGKGWRCVWCETETSTLLHVVAPVGYKS